MGSRRTRGRLPRLTFPSLMTRRGCLVARAGCAVALLLVIASGSSAWIAPRRAAAAGAERVVAPGDFGGSVTVKVGDALVVRPPMNAAQWQVAYDTAFLTFQGTPDNLAHPDANGWTFHVIRAGETSLTVTPVMRGGPNPPRFSVGIHIDA
jgi:hypothetical protein